MAELSDRLLAMAIIGYVLAMLFYTAEYAFGSRGGRFAERWLKNTSVQVGVSNVFNKTPAFDAYYADSYYYSPFGDPRISDYWLSVSKKF